ncbi:MAG: hypothetical protein R2880_19045 [Deinococcales bacterium]
MIKIPLWHSDHVRVKQLADDFASYVYLRRLTRPEVLYKAIHEGLSPDIKGPFAYADDWDEARAVILA